MVFTDDVQMKADDVDGSRINDYHHFGFINQWQ